MAVTHTPINLEDFDKFKSHVWLTTAAQEYDKECILADCAYTQLINDLESLNKSFAEKYGGRVAFTTIEGRVKSKDSFLRKIYKICREQSVVSGITQDVIQENCFEINDLCGVRFSCPYFDEVTQAINKFIRPQLSILGYATDLQEDPRYKDRDYLDLGDQFGYRSYHFFVKVPTLIDIYGNVKLCLCEVQARTELQHVWAVKSHDLIYKPELGWNLDDDSVVENMRQVSNSLRAADHYLVDIRKRIKGESSYYDKI